MQGSFAVSRAHRQLPYRAFPRTKFFERRSSSSASSLRISSALCATHTHTQCVDGPSLTSSIAEDTKQEAGSTVRH